MSVLAIVEAVGLGLLVVALASCGYMLWEFRDVFTRGKR